jgi:hypothetical protein
MIFLRGTGAFTKIVDQQLVTLIDKPFCIGFGA